jgi:hypothetical protein
MVAKKIHLMYAYLTLHYIVHICTNELTPNYYLYTVNPVIEPHSGARLKYRAPLPENF